MASRIWCMDLWVFPDFNNDGGQNLNKQLPNVFQLSARNATDQCVKCRMYPTIGPLSPVLPPEALPDLILCRS